MKSTLKRNDFKYKNHSLPNIEKSSILNNELNNNIGKNNNIISIFDEFNIKKRENKSKKIVNFKQLLSKTHNNFNKISISSPENSSLKKKFKFAKTTTEIFENVNLNKDNKNLKVRIQSEINTMLYKEKEKNIKIDRDISYLFEKNLKNNSVDSNLSFPEFYYKKYNEKDENSNSHKKITKNNDLSKRFYQNFDFSIIFEKNDIKIDFEKNCSIENLISLNEKLDLLNIKENDKKEEYNFFLNNLVKDLKKSHSGFFSKGPAGRIQVKKLNEWLEKTIKMICFDIQAEKEKKFILIDEALNITLYELIRQISFNCFERGLFLFKIWNFYFDYLKKFISFEKETKNFCIGESKKNHLIKLHNLEEKINYKNDKINNKNEMIDKLKQEIELLKDKIENQEETFVSNKNHIEKYKTMAINLKNQNLKLKEENDQLLNKIYSFKQKNLLKETELKKEISKEKTRKLSSFDESIDLDESNEKFLQSIVNQFECDHKNIMEENFENNIIIKKNNDNEEKILFSKTTEIDFFEFGFRKNAEIQTDLNLVNNKFDKIMLNDVVEDLLEEYNYKKKLVDLENVNINSEKKVSRKERDSFFKFLTKENEERQSKFEKPSKNIIIIKNFDDNPVYSPKNTLESFTESSNVKFLKY